MWKCKGPRTVETPLKKNKTVGNIFPDFKIYLKVLVIETMWYWHGYIYIYGTELRIQT